jgi:hypothetical protein
MDHKTIRVSEVHLSLMLVSGGSPAKMDIVSSIDIWVEFGRRLC